MKVLLIQCQDQDLNLGLQAMAEPLSNLDCYISDSLLYPWTSPVQFLAQPTVNTELLASPWNILLKPGLQNFHLPDYCDLTNIFLSMLRPSDQTV